MVACVKIWILYVQWSCLYVPVLWEPSKTWSSNLSPFIVTGRSRWLRGVRQASTALTRWDCGFVSWRGAWMSVCCECCLLSCRGLCDGPIPRSEESYRLCVSVIRFNSNILDLQRVGRKWSRLRIRKKDRIKKECCYCRPSHIHTVMHSLYELYT